MKPLFKLGALCLIALLSSCDPSGSDTYIVRNNSSKAIVFEEGSALQVDKTTDVSPGQAVTYTQESGIGHGVSAADRDGKFNPQRLYRVKRDSAVSQKDIYSYANWLHTKQKKYEYTHTLVITDSDFQ